MFAVKTMEGEVVEVHDIEGLDVNETIENIPALIELCRLPDAPPSGSPPTFTLQYA